MTLAPEHKRRLLAAARSEPAPMRRSVRLASLGILVASAALLTVLFWKLGWFTPGDRPLAFVLGTSVGWMAIASAASWLALGRGGRMGGRPTATLIGTAVGAPVLLLGWLMLCNLVYPPSACAAGISEFGTACHELIVAMSAVMFTAFAAVRRFGDPIHPKSGGAALGVAAASWAGLVLNLRCTCATPMHVAVGHVLPLVVASVAGISLGWWLLRLRPQR